MESPRLTCALKGRGAGGASGRGSLRRSADAVEGSQVRVEAMKMKQSRRSGLGIILREKRGARQVFRGI